MTALEAGTNLLSHYRELEARWVVTDRVADYASLVVPNGNSEQPFHRWFHFKEGYSHRLVDVLLAEAGAIDGVAVNVLDPFSGSGTTVLSSIDRQRTMPIAGRLQGIERNPVMHAISAAKILGASRGKDLGERVVDGSARFWDRYKDVLATESDSLNTQSATLNNETYFAPESVRALLAMARSARSEEDAEVSAVLLACVAISVEATGRLRRDGRALRYSPRKVVRSAEDAMQVALERAVQDMLGVDTQFQGAATVELADARTFTPDPACQFDWAIFSPPYPNNIDYTEVYKNEAWVMEVFRDRKDMKDQRLQTLRSHPSVRFPDNYEYSTSPVAAAVDALIDPILSAIPEDHYLRGRTQLVKGYADDMLKVLANVRAGMSVDGKCAVVVGNSSHGRQPSHFIVASDLLLARLAELSGWSVDEIRVARRPKRRADSEGWLRESIVMLRCAQE